MSIDCNDLCKSELQIMNKLIRDKGTVDEIQNANIDYNSCITACNLRKHRNDGGGKRKNTSAKLKMGGLAHAQITVKKRCGGGGGSWI